MDYAVPRAFFREGMLGKLVTDLYFSSPLSVKLAVLHRYRSDIPGEFVVRNLGAGLAYRLLLRLRRGEASPHLFAAEALGRVTVKAIEDVSAKILYGFDTALLPILARVDALGCSVIMEQCIAPRMHLIKLIPSLAERVEKTGISSKESGLDVVLGYLELLAAIERAEWEQASLIVCPSRFVRDELLGLGVPEAKTIIIPYGVTVASNLVQKRSPGGRGTKLKVAFVGTFSYRKGAVDYCQLASRYDGRAEFHAFGSIMLPKPVMDKIAGSIIIRGHLSRDALFRELSQFDVLILPSYSEGSATVVYECMALGLVCIVSDASGSVITSGLDGLIFEAGDDRGMFNAFEAVMSSPSFRCSMSEAAVETSKAFTRESYGARVVSSTKAFCKQLE
ncbi:glycosyltransferase family 4 protein [Mesorhizobium sp. M0933]|uniref:glycosyltransferase family 4 protein n=1 Tax=Mesorhizobium sp. M0933 TaxID=2957030 RepID=UPI00333DE15D